MFYVCTCVYIHWCDVNHKIPKGLVAAISNDESHKNNGDSVFPLELWKMLFFPERNWYGSDGKWIDTYKLEHAWKKKEQFAVRFAYLIRKNRYYQLDHAEGKRERERIRDRRRARVRGEAQEQQNPCGCSRWANSTIGKQYKSPYCLLNLAMLCRSNGVNRKLKTNKTVLLPVFLFRVIKRCGGSVSILP